MVLTSLKYTLNRIFLEDRMKRTAGMNGRPVTLHQPTAKARRQRANGYALCLRAFTV